MLIYPPVFFFFFFTSLHFLCWICVRYIVNLPIYRRYIADTEQFFSIFPRNDFHLQKSYRDGPTPEISKIYHRYFATFLTLLMGECKETLEVHLMVVKEEVESKDLVEA